MNKVLETTKIVVDDSQFVSIDPVALKTACTLYQPEKSSVWWADAAPFPVKELDLKNTIAFILLLNSINYCYWGEPKWTVEYCDKKLDGAWGAIASFYRALSEGFDLLDPNVLKDLSKKDLAYIFRGNVEISLFCERLDCLKELGRIVVQKFDGEFSKIIEKGDYDAVKILGILVDNFDAYKDESIYKGEKVYFWKRAQLAVGDIADRLKDTETPILKTDDLTAAADYKLPQSLRKLGVLKYADKLAKKVDNKIKIKPESLEEIEIRANMIWAVELMRQEIKLRLSDVIAADIDHWLWLKGQVKSSDDKPYHLTRTIKY